MLPQASAAAAALLLVAFLAPGCAHSVSEPPPPAPVSIDVFYEDLAPYGQWMDLPPYGPVWRPSGVPPGWMPYTLGRWEYTDAGWLWVSDEAWGWAPFHYGRWGFDPGLGWFWVPGYDWGPAWVAWRVGPDVVGWAPLAPGMALGVTAYPFPADRFVFVPTDRFVGSRVASVALPPAEAPALLHRTSPAPPPGRGGPPHGGPIPAEVSKRAGRPIAPRPIVAAPSPAAAARPPSAGGIPVFRPSGRAAPRGTPRSGVAAPSSPRPAAPGPPATGSAATPPPPAARPAPAPPPPRPHPEERRKPPAGEEHRGAPAPAPRPEGG